MAQVVGQVLCLLLWIFWTFLGGVLYFFRTCIKIILIDTPLSLGYWSLIFQKYQLYFYHLTGYFALNTIKS